jgi:hypothetical protein
MFHQVLPTMFVWLAGIIYAGGGLASRLSSALQAKGSPRPLTGESDSPSS